MAIEVHINGQARRLPEGMTLGAMVQQLELQPQQIAIEVNLQLVPRAEHHAYELAAGDCVEIVTLVGGG